MADFPELQKKLDEIKSKIEDLELELKTASQQHKQNMEQEIKKLRDEQFKITQRIEEQTGLSGILGDIHKGN